MIQKIRKVTLRIIILICLNIFVFGQIGYAREDPFLSRVNEIKELYRFSEWADVVKIPNKLYTKLPVKEEDFKQYGEIKVFTSEKERDRSLRISLLGNQRTSSVSISISLHASPLEAKGSIINEFSLVTFPGAICQRAEKGNKMDIGDVCFSSIRNEAPVGAHGKTTAPFMQRLYFTRNNISVRIINNAEENKQYLDIAELAKFIDQRLVERF